MAMEQQLVVFYFNGLMVGGNLDNLLAFLLLFTKHLDNGLDLFPMGGVMKNGLESVAKEMVHKLHLYVCCDHPTIHCKKHGSIKLVIRLCRHLRIGF